MNDLEKRVLVLHDILERSVLTATALDAIDEALRNESRLALEAAACLVDQHDSGEILHCDLAHAIRALRKNKDD